MIVRMDDFYRTNYKGRKFDFKDLELKESTQMCIVGSEEKDILPRILGKMYWKLPQCLGVFLYFMNIETRIKRWYNILYDNHLLTKYKKVNK